MPTFVALTSANDDKTVFVNMDTVIKMQWDDAGHTILTFASSQETLAVRERPPKVLDLIRDRQG